MEIEVILQNDRCAMMKNTVDEDDPDDSEILMRLCLTRTNVKVTDLNLDIVDVGAAQELVQDPVTVVGIVRAARAARAEAERQVTD